MTEVARTRQRPPPMAVQPVSSEPSELDKVLADVRKNYGDKVMTIASAKPQWTHIPTGIFTLDMALLGGVPEGLCTQFIGWESSGKTTLAMRTVGNAQRKRPDKKAVYVDIEGTYDPAWGAVHGVDNTCLHLVQPQTGEMALDIVDAVVRANDVSIVVIDSLPAITPFKEVDGAMEDQLPGLQARLIGKFLRKLQQAFLDERKRDHYPTVLLINQWRMKIGVIKGDPRTAPGGIAIKYVKSVDVEIKNHENTEGKDDRGNNVVDFNEHSFTIKKNKTGNSLRSGEFRMIRNPDHPFGAGFIDDAETVLTYMRRFGLCTGSGSSWRLDGVDIRFQRLKDMVDHMYSNPQYFADQQFRLLSMQREKMGLIPTGWY